MEGSKALELCMNVLKPRGITGENTLFAQSVCPDEINHEADGLPELLAKELGAKFHMGGLGGVPFTGQTGFVAYSHHVPDGKLIF